MVDIGNRYAQVKGKEDPKVNIVTYDLTYEDLAQWEVQVPLFVKDMTNLVNEEIRQEQASVQRGPYRMPVRRLTASAEAGNKTNNDSTFINEYINLIKYNKYFLCY